MTLHWDINTGLVLHHDDREITPAIREAVDTWVAERTGWVAVPIPIFGADVAELATDVPIYIKC